MLARAILAIVNRSPKARRLVFRKLFEYLARRCQHVTNWTQMNYGYADGPGLGHTVDLEPNEERERYCHQLYYRVVNGTHLSGKDVVEVSCGRGGGAAFVHRFFAPRTMTGIDLASGAVDFCRRLHRSSQLRFLQGDAEDLPLFDESADALINVEASLCYGDVQKFFGEVYRVLRPGGHFLYTDLQATESIGDVLRSLRQSGFDVLHADDITANVARALELDAQSRLDLVRATAPWGLRKLMGAFAGTPETCVPMRLASGERQYWCLTLRKGLTEEGDGTTSSTACRDRESVLA